MPTFCVMKMTENCSKMRENGKKGTETGKTGRNGEETFVNILNSATL